MRGISLLLWINDCSYIHVQFQCLFTVSDPSVSDSTLNSQFWNPLLNLHVFFFFRPVEFAPLQDFTYGVTHLSYLRITRYTLLFIQTSLSSICYLSELSVRFLKPRGTLLFAYQFSVSFFRSPSHSCSLTTNTRHPPLPSGSITTFTQ